MTEKIPANPSQPATGMLSSSHEAADISAVRSRWALVERINPLVWPTIVIMVLLALSSDKFLTTTNLLNVLRAAAVVTIIGVGQTFVIASRNLDLSVGSMLALIMALMGTFVLGGGPVWLAWVLAIALGAMLGLFNGLVVTMLRVPALLATLGTLVLYRGIVQQYMYGSTHSRFPQSLIALGQTTVGPVPILVVFAAIIVTLGLLLLRLTRFGRYMIAIGGNAEAARLAGIRVRLWTALVFVFQGALVGAAALPLMGRLNSVHPSVGAGMEIHIIAGVVLGGTSLFGGSAAIGGMVLAMFLIGILENGLLLSGAGFFWQQIFLGVLIILAVAVQMRRSRQEKLF